MATIRSDATPLQFYPIGCETWNQSSPEGEHHYKFCEPWNCDDVIKDQFIDDVGAEFDLVAYNDDDVEIARKAYDKLSMTVVPDMQSLTDWLNWSGFGTAWNVGAHPSVTLAVVAFSTFSKYNKGEFDGQDGILYAFYYDVNLVLSAGATAFVAMALLDEDENVLATDTDIYNTSGNKTGTLSLTPSADCTHVAIRVTAITNDVSATVNSIVNSSVPQSGPENSIEFIPSDYGICDQEIYFKIIRTSGTPDAEEWITDGLSIKTAHKETILINYSNHRNTAGINYSNISPDTDFNIRIPAVFNKQRLPQENESLQLSSNRIISLFGQVKVQKLLSTGRMPSCMHLKIALILQHQFIYIQGQYWIKEETYEWVEPTRRDSLERYEIWLTKKDYVVRNIL